MGGLWHLTHWRWERCLLAVGPHFNTFCCYHPLAVGTLLTFGLNMLPSCPLAVGICLLFAAFSWMFTQWCPQWLYITHWRWESVRCSPIASLICTAIFTPGGGNKNLNAACSITCTMIIYYPLAVGICALFADSQSNLHSYIYPWRGEWKSECCLQHHLHNFYWGIWWLSIHKCDFILIGSGWCCMNNFWQSGDRVPIFTHWRGEFYRVMESTIHKMVHLK